MVEPLSRRTTLAALGAACSLPFGLIAPIAGAAPPSRDARRRGDRARVGHHRRYRLNTRNELVEVDAGPLPARGSVAAAFDHYKRRQRGLNARLSAPDVERQVRRAPPATAGIFPLKVTTFTTSCEGPDLDGAAAQLTDRLGNLRVITQVPFMRRGNVIFGIRAQGLVDPRTGAAECVDALFGGGIYWHGRLTQTSFDYELVLFKRGKDSFVGRMVESIDLTSKVGDIDPALYQAEVAYHLDRESPDAAGRPTLARNLEAYGSADQLAEVEGCYEASARFAAEAARNGIGLKDAMTHAADACVDVPGKRYYQAYDAWLRGFAYDPAMRP